MSSFKELVLNILFPIECISCGREDHHLCPACLNIFKKDLKYTYRKNATLDNLDGFFVIFNYNDAKISKLIKLFKYSLVRDIGPILGNLAAAYLKTNKINLKNTILAPIPLSRQRLNWRGFNQAEIIASAISTELKLPISDSLVKIKHNKPQAKILKEEQRWLNIKNCFQWTGHDLSGKNILLIDDVSTTGATLNECATVLKQAGAKKVEGLVIAHG